MHPRFFFFLRKQTFFRWLKPETVDEMKFVSKDVLLIRAGNSLIFYDVCTQKENILIVDSRSDEEHDLPLKSIGCVDCCDIDLLALAEQPPIPKVVICLYPDLKVLSTLVGMYGKYINILYL